MGQREIDKHLKLLMDESIVYGIPTLVIGDRESRVGVLPVLLQDEIFDPSVFGCIPYKCVDVTVLFDNIRKHNASIKTSATVSRPALIGCSDVFYEFEPIQVRHLSQLFKDINVPYIIVFTGVGS